jgi:serine/threonine protein kinase
MSDWTRVRTLFELALEQEPSGVEAWLLQQEVENPEVRDEVLNLLRHHRQAGTFLASPLCERHSDLWADDNELRADQVVGPYRIIREIGRGGMGRVYLADDTRLQRRVALKALPPELTASESQRERLRREARAAAALAHPGICTVYALDEYDGQLFIASEFIEGHTLRDEIAQKKHPPSQDVLRAAREIAEALSAAHEKGIVHRDLKPENIIRTAEGRLKVLDFGVAKDARLDAGADRLTQTGTVIGTPAYMAPEQLNGKPADARADVFAFGVVIYEYACGTHPFAAATSLSTAARVLEGTSRPLGLVRADLPNAVLTAVDRALRKAPSERFSSAAELVEALASDKGRQPATTLSWWRTHQAIIIALYVVACVMLWNIKEIHPGPATLVFLVAGVLATTGTIFRGHLVFTEHLHRTTLAKQKARAGPVTLGVDGAIAAGLVWAGGLWATTSALPGVLTMALGIGIALARLVLEPSTTSAAFPDLD